jgi:tetratricopeptide (TPR) repeat protein
LAVKPASPVAHNNLGVALDAKGDREGAIRSYHEAIRLDQRFVLAHSNLGNALHHKKDLKGAIRCYNEAIPLDPKDHKPHINLALVLRDEGDWDGAISCCREAIRINPNYAGGHINLGNALAAKGDKGDMEAAIRSFRKAIQLDPTDPRAPTNLGASLLDTGDVEGAIRSFHEAIQLDQKYADAHAHLGAALLERDVEAAIRSCREALRLNPKHAGAYINLGNALAAKGDREGAIRSYRDAIRHEPKEAKAHYNLGYELLEKEPIDKGDLEEAIRSLREAIRLKPKYAEAHGVLGQALILFGDFNQALVSTRLAAKLLPPEDPQQKRVRKQLAYCQSMLRGEQVLDAVLAGKRTPKNARERVALADIAQRPAKQLYLRAIGLYRDAFEAEPGLAGPSRYFASSVAILAGTGKGKDIGRLDETDRAPLRYAALCWLQEDLTVHARILKGRLPENANRSRKTLLHWRADPDFAAVRDPALLRQLPESEQAAWRNLWAQVDALLVPSPAGK